MTHEKSSVFATRQHLDRQIAQALDTGQLTAIQANTLRADLERIAADESARQRARLLPHQTAIVLRYARNSLSDKLAPVIQTLGATPVISRHFVTVDGPVTTPGNATYTKLQPQTRIGDTYAAGQPARDQVSTVRVESDFATGDGIHNGWTIE